MKERVFVAKSTTEDTDTRADIVSKICRLYIRDLLADSKTKKRIDDDLVKSARASAYASTDSYFADCLKKGTIPIAITMCDVYANRISKTRRVLPDDPDWSTLKKYTDLSVLVWNLVYSTHRGKYHSMNVMIKSDRKSVV